MNPFLTRLSPVIGGYDDRINFVDDGAICFSVYAVDKSIKEFTVAPALSARGREHGGGALSLCKCTVLTLLTAATSCELSLAAPISSQR